MDRSSFDVEYRNRIETYKRLMEEAVFSLTSALNAADIRVHQILPRVKTADSLYEKALRKNIKDPFKINDIVGLRVICLFLSDLPLVSKVIKQAFQVLREDDKINPDNPAGFGYMSVHYIASMRQDHVGPRYQGLQGLRFEIQVRTICMDAWANISHHLDYKTDSDIPDELKRDFYALSGLFYVADKHFELFYCARQAEQEAIGKSLMNQEINLDSLTAYLRERYPDRQSSGSKAISLLVSLLIQAGYKTIDQLNNALEKAKNALGAEERTSARREGESLPYYTDVGVVRVSLRLTDPRFNAVDKVDI